jgi:hypothetical protein
MSDGNIYSDNEKYGGFGAAMANSLVVNSKSKLSGLVNVFMLVLPLVCWWWWCCCLFLFLAMDNGEFNNGGGIATANS